MRATTWAAAVLALAAAATAEELPPVVVDALPASLAGAWLFRTGNDPAWSSPFRERRSWQRILVPGAWERHGYPGYNGHAWYRLSLFVSSRLAAEELGLDLGLVGDTDEVFLNGRRVGATGSPPPNFEKATLAHRFYVLPREAIRFGEYNELAIHVFNDIRFGGLLGPAPLIDRWEAILRRQVLRDLLCFSFVALLCTLAFFHGSLYLAQRKRVEHLAFAAFLVLNGAYFLTYAHWGPVLLLGHNLNFRLNVVTFLAALAAFPPALYRLAHRPVPVPVVVAQTSLALGAAFALVWRDEGDLYFWIYLAEAAVISFSVVMVTVLLSLARQRHLWARWLLAATVLIAALVTVDILVDAGVLRRTAVTVGELFEPLGLVPFCLLFSLALAHAWVEDRWGEPVDLATGLIPRERFAERLAGELERSRRHTTPLAVALLRLDSGELAGGHDQTREGAVFVLRRSLRQIDLLARWDPDTFAVLLAETEERAAVATLERLRRAVSESPPAGQARLRTTAGVAQFRQNRHLRPDDLLSEAEAALYAALSEGGGCTATAP